MKSIQIHKPLIFISTILPGNRSEVHSLILAESIRKYARSLATIPIWFLYPEKETGFSNRIIDRFHELKIQLIPTRAERYDTQTFFYWKVQALAEAETLATNESELMVWLDPNTLVLDEPSHFIIPIEKQLGYKPVHHLLLGSRFEEDVDPFWAEIYKLCIVHPDDIFSMEPMIENIQMRPYFNAGLLVTRPKNRLFEKWLTLFHTALQKPTFQKYVKEDKRYGIFLHQALLSGLILNLFSKEQLIEFPKKYNYPIHLWGEDLTDKRPPRLDQCVTIRHEGFSNEESWKTEDAFNVDLLRWLQEKFTYYEIRD